MKIEINKKGFFALLALSASIAFADYVTVVGKNSSGGYIVNESMTENDIEEVLDRTMPVGSLALRLDNINPSEIYGGTWQLVTGDASLRLGDGSIQSGATSGNNNPIVPVPRHSHTATASEDTHSHTYYSPSRSYAGQIPGSGTRKFQDNGAEGTISYTTTSDTHGHTITVNSAGTSDATINVRGESLMVNVWKRTM